MTYTFDLLEKIAYQEKIAFGLLKRVATQPIPGVVYNPLDINVATLEDYLAHRLSKSLYDSVETLVNAAALIELPDGIKHQGKVKYRIPEAGEQFQNKHGLYTVIWSNADIILGHTEDDIAPSYARYKLITLPTFAKEAVKVESESVAE